jgi:D-aminopeptidase
VDSPALMPHVSYVVMKKRLDQASAANPKSKKANDELLAQITAARGK